MRSYTNQQLTSLTVELGGPGNTAKSEGSVIGMAIHGVRLAGYGKCKGENMKILESSIVSNDWSEAVKNNMTMLNSEQIDQVSGGFAITCTWPGSNGSSSITCTLTW